jgi:hypothetical protein
LAERVHREELGRFVFLGLHVDADELIWHLLLREGECDDASTPSYVWRCIKFEHHGGIYK